MSIKVLWPHIRWGDDCAIEIEALGKGVTGEFSTDVKKVSDEQWATCDGVVCTFDIPEEYISQMKRCRIFVKRTVGCDNIDLERWGKLGIPVCNNPHYGTSEVADHTIALMLTLIRGINFHNERLRVDPGGNWTRTLNPFAKRLSNCILGIVGLGRIGTAVASRAQAFGMEVIYHDPYKSEENVTIAVRRVNSLTELVAQCDVLSLHTPLNDETRHMVGGDVFKVAKPGLILINSSRGAVIDFDALYEAIKNKIVLAAGLDVLPTEPADLNDPLVRAWNSGEKWIKDRLILTPHHAFFTPESVHDMRAFAAQTAAHYLRDGKLEHCVNREFLTFRR
ncbi:MAG: C-terminal binding protein [Acidobacteriota bacterium]|nr:C-terminal binding protein [Acidobacteriota bacterium]